MKYVKMAVAALGLAALAFLAVAPSAVASVDTQGSVRITP